MYRGKGKSVEAEFASAAVIVMQDGSATYEPLFAGKDLLELYPGAKKIILFASVSDAAYYAAGYRE